MIFGTKRLELDEQGRPRPRRVLMLKRRPQDARRQSGAAKRRKRK